MAMAGETPAPPDVKEGKDDGEATWRRGKLGRGEREEEGSA